MLLLDGMVEEGVKSEFLKSEILTCEAHSKFYSAVWNKVDSMNEDSIKLHIFLSYRGEQINDLFRQDVVDYMIYDYHNYLTKKKTSKQNILDRITSCNEIDRKEIEAKNEEEYKVIRYNISEFVLGDTIVLIVPCDNWGGKGKNVYFKSYPFTLNYKELGDSLMIEAIIIDKIDCTSITNEEEAYAAKFKLKIINEDEYYNLGPTFELPLKIYGRPFLRP